MNTPRARTTNDLTLFISFIFSLILGATSIASQAYSCATSCIAPDCYCASPQLPSGLSRSETPQFVVITFDDALHETASDLTEQIAGQQHSNPNGSIVPFTYYVSTNYTNYHLVQQRYAQGHEIAVHTMTHTTDTQTSYDVWRAEIVGAREALSNIAEIPLADVVGFRAPFLQHSDLSTAVLHEEGFLYDSSIAEAPGLLSNNAAEFIWPYTLDSMGAQECHSGECPQYNYPGLWQVPMWMLLDEANRPMAVMDPPGTRDSLLNLFSHNFDQRHQGNRAPLGIFLHAGWLSNPQHVQAVNDFIQYANTHNDVWFVTNRQLIEWIKNPVPANEMNTWEWVQPQSPSTIIEIADGWDNDSDGAVDEDSKQTCNYSFSTFETNNAACPNNYPSLSVIPFYQITTTVALSSDVEVTCADPEWDPTRTYVGGETVSYQGNTYVTKWWAGQSNPTGGNAWQDLGTCMPLGGSGGRISAGQKRFYPSGSNAFFEFIADNGFRVENVTVNNVAQTSAPQYQFENISQDLHLTVSFTLDEDARSFSVPILNGLGAISLALCLSFLGMRKYKEEK